MVVIYQRQLPPNIARIIAPPEYSQDEDLMERIIDDKMVKDYVTVMFICSVLLGLVILI